MRKRMIGPLVGVGVLALVVTARTALSKGHKGRRLLRETGDHTLRQVRRLSGRWQGVSYRLKGRHPNPDVPDLVLADRIRSSLGPLEKRLDIPRVHVMVEDHTALLHGEVETEEQLQAVEDAVARIAGVVGVESYLHLGLISGDSRPSDAVRTPTPSDARQRLLDAARAAGVADAQAVTAVRAVLASLARRIPADELDQVMAHLPDDVKSLMQPPRRTGAAFRRVRTVPEFVAAVVSADGMSADSAQRVIGAVLGELKELVPEEVADVGAVLPSELRDLWQSSHL